MNIPVFEGQYHNPPDGRTEVHIFEERTSGRNLEHQTDGRTDSKYTDIWTDGRPNNIVLINIRRADGRTDSKWTDIWTDGRSKGQSNIVLINIRRTDGRTDSKWTDRRTVKCQINIVLININRAKDDGRTVSSNETDQQNFMQNKSRDTCAKTVCDVYLLQFGWIHSSNGRLKTSGRLKKDTFLFFCWIYLNNFIWITWTLYFFYFESNKK